MLAEACCKRSRNCCKLLRIGWRPGAAQHCNHPQALRVRILQQRCGRRPIRAAAVGGQRLPIKFLAHPAKANARNITQRCLLRCRRRAQQRNIYARQIGRALRQAGRAAASAHTARILHQQRNAGCQQARSADGTERWQPALLFHGIHVGLLVCPSPVSCCATPLLISITHRSPPSMKASMLPAGDQAGSCGNKPDSPAAG